MSQTITAIYADGALHPLAQLDLPEQAEIELEVLRVATPEEDERSRVLRGLADAGVIINKPYEPPSPSPISEPADERRRIIEALAQAGLLANTPALYPIPEESVSEEEEEELAQIFAGAKPFSEIIIEEREEGGSNESNNFRNLR